VHGFPSYASVVDRWRKIADWEKSPIYIDLKSIVERRTSEFDVWIKEAPEESLSDSKYTMLRFEANCNIQTARITQVKKQGGGGRTGHITPQSRAISPVPNSIEETVLDLLCSQSKR
jgi:hypothetical protein